MIGSVFTILFGSVLLYFGADWMVKSSIHIASKLKISKFVIGLTVVAFGTSLPELGVSLKAAIFDKSGIAIGNILGSNIANIALVFGVCSFIYPIVLSYSKIKKDLMVFLCACGMLVIFMWDGILEQLEGVILFSALISYTIHAFLVGDDEEGNIEDTNSSWIWTIGMLAFGIGFLFFGTEYFIEGSIKLAKIIGVSDLIIGMSVVALGTSLPELVTSLIAGIKKESSISIGNILGSNIFNILSVLGLVSIFKPLAVESSIFYFEIPFMIATAVFLIPISLRNRPISKYISIAMVSVYVFFIFILFK